MKTIRLRMLERIQTTDAALHTTKDVLLTCPTAAEWAAYAKSVAKVDLGQVWNGVEAQMEALDDDQRKALCDRFDAYRELKAGDAGKEKRKKATGALDGEPDYDILGRRESGKFGEEMNARARALWNQQPR
jgi:hypothetical protein